MKSKALLIIAATVSATSLIAQDSQTLKDNIIQPSASTVPQSGYRLIKINNQTGYPVIAKFSGDKVAYSQQGAPFGGCSQATYHPRQSDTNFPSTLQHSRTVTIALPSGNTYNIPVPLYGGIQLPDIPDIGRYYVCENFNDSSAQVNFVLQPNASASDDYLQKHKELSQLTGYSFAVFNQTIKNGATYTLTLVPAQSGQAGKKQLQVTIS